MKRRKASKICLTAGFVLLATPLFAQENSGFATGTSAMRDPIGDHIPPSTRPPAGLADLEPYRPPVSPDLAAPVSEPAATTTPVATTSVPANDVVAPEQIQPSPAAVVATPPAIIPSAEPETASPAPTVAPQSVQAATPPPPAVQTPPTDAATASPQPLPPLPVESASTLPPMFSLITQEFDSPQVMQLKATLRLFAGYSATVGTLKVCQGKGQTDAATAMNEFHKRNGNTLGVIMATLKRIANLPLDSEMKAAIDSNVASEVRANSANCAGFISLVQGGGRDLYKSPVYAADYTTMRTPPSNIPVEMPSE